MKTTQEFDQLYAFIAYSRDFVTVDSEIERLSNDVQIGIDNIMQHDNSCILYGIDAL